MYDQVLTLMTQTALPILKGGAIVDW